MNAELALLRAFYLDWERFHAKARSPIEREMKVAAQELSDSANALRNFYQSQDVLKTPDMADA